jgi:hypothetical protein
MAATESGGGATVIERGLLAACESASVAVTVKLKLPVAVGVPDMTPVAAAILNPPGRPPAVTDQT